MATKNVSADHGDFGARLASQNMAALWELRRGMDLTKPKSPAVPAIWRYDAIRPDIEESGRQITAKDAFRRVLVLENPAFRGEMRITNTLYAGLQLVLPGEIAPCHRHSQTALRFIVEGEGAYTAVGGERTILHRGDFVITPNWAWHDHGNESQAPVVWLDGLDTPLVDFLDTVFREFYPEETFPQSRPMGDAPARFGSGMLPYGERPDDPASPIFNYAYGPAREALETMRRAGRYDPCHGIKMQYVNPLTGDYPMPTMAAFLQLLPDRFATEPYRATDGAVYCVVEGSGRTIVDGEIFAWAPNDVFVVPGWRHHHHEADGDAVLFSFSDRPVQQKLGLWREERGDDPDSSA